MEEVKKPIADKAPISKPDVPSEREVQIRQKQAQARYRRQLNVYR